MKALKIILVIVVALAILYFAYVALIKKAPDKPAVQPTQSGKAYTKAKDTVTPKKNLVDIKQLDVQ